ncbi:hypothetical protein [uncultured Roseobacter sp.]|uniref:hypothetical protein n=1 Tax=uncultured Roseobacter sp. TaxID=114847 RepID=UPI002619F066|nr:hypothetical protein [uncultured Roseobacter sp.]
MAWDATAAFFGEHILGPGIRSMLRDGEELADELHLAAVAGLLVLDVAAREGPDHVDRARGGFGRSRGSVALMKSE